jgi:hypothetical protein
MNYKTMGISALATVVISGAVVYASNTYRPFRFLGGRA